MAACKQDALQVQRGLGIFQRQDQIGWCGREALADVRSVCLAAGMQDYRRDIDGLRAYAVVPVLLFHAGFSSFAGGFVGVDIFFVISGFVITRAILKMQDRGSFSFLGFFASRLRRLYPAVLTTTAVSALFASLLFSPDDLSQFGHSVVWTLSGVSNVYFWQTMGDYWSTSKWTTPMLHTWSLAVETQFYLMWPLLVVFTPRRLLLPAMGLLAIASLVAAEFWLRIDPVAAFYLMPFRVVEFAIGGMLVFAGEARRYADAILALGLLLLGLSIGFTPEDPFPGLWALPACVGTALCIYAGRAPLVGKVLDNRAAVWIGTVSYSVYLAHWPLIIFWRYFSYEPLDHTDGVIIVVLSFVFASASYYLVEKPFRDGARFPVKSFVTACAALAALISVPAVSMALSGWDWRVTAKLDEDSRRYGGYGCPHPFCSSETGAGKEIALTGDSHARMYFGGLEERLGGKTPFSVWHFDARCRFVNDPDENGLPDYDCDERLKTYLDYVQDRKIETLILAYRWSKVAGKIPIAQRGEVIAKRTRDWLNRPEMRSVKNILLVLQAPEMDDGQTPAACLRVPSYLVKRDCATVDVDDFLLERGLNRRILDAMRAEMPKRIRLTVANPFRPLCDEKRCLRMKGDAVLYSDEHHLSRHGSRLVVSDWKLTSLLETP